MKISLKHKKKEWLYREAPGSVLKKACLIVACIILNDEVVVICRYARKE